jgi:proline iminopeptidase
MTMRAWLIGGTATMIVLVAVGAVMYFMSWGRAMYQPGDIAAKAAKGLIKLEPSGGIVFEARRGDGTQEFSLEAEKGIVLAGFRRGEGRPAIVIFGGPGYPSNEAWPGLRPFESQRCFYYYHQRGSGLSTRPIDRFPAGSFPANVAELDEKLGLAQQISDVERLRRAIGAEKIDLVGHSFGGFIAALYAIEFPEHAGKLLLIAPAEVVVMPPKDGGLYEEIRALLGPEDKKAYEAWLKAFFDYSRLFARSEDELRRINVGFIPFYKKAVAAKGTVDESIDRTDPSLVAGWMMRAVFFSMGRRHDYTAALSRIASPVTMVYGTGDTGGAAMFDQYKTIPGLKSIELSGGDHFVAYDVVRFPKAVAQFFE